MEGQLNSKVVKETGSNPWARMARNLGIGFMASVFAGIIFGLLLRLVMGIIAFFFPHLASGFTFFGTFLLVILGIAVTLANSILFIIIFHKSSMSWVRKGFWYGLICLFIYGTPLFLSNPNNELFRPQAPLGISLFSALFFIGPLLLALFIERISNCIDRSNLRIKLTYISFALLSIPAIVMLVNIFMEIFYEMLPKIIDNLSRV